MNYGVQIWRGRCGLRGDGPWLGGVLVVRAESEADALMEACRQINQDSPTISVGNVYELRDLSVIEAATRKLREYRTKRKAKP